MTDLEKVTAQRDLLFQSAKALVDSISGNIASKTTDRAFIDLFMALEEVQKEINNG